MVLRNNTFFNTYKIVIHRYQLNTKLKMDIKLQRINNLFADIKHIIEKAKKDIVVTVNSATTILHWNIGMQINKKILDFKRSEYGKEVIKSL